jgi:hypothetical protein
MRHEDDADAFGQATFPHGGLNLVGDVQQALAERRLQLNRGQPFHRREYTPGAAAAAAEIVVTGRVEASTSSLS